MPLCHLRIAATARHRLPHNRADSASQQALLDPGCLEAVRSAASRFHRLPITTSSFRVLRKRPGMSAAEKSDKAAIIADVCGRLSSSGVDAAIAVLHREYK